MNTPEWKRQHAAKVAAEQAQRAQEIEQAREASERMRAELAAKKTEQDALMLQVQQRREAWERGEMPPTDPATLPTFESVFKANAAIIEAEQAARQAEIDASPEHQRFANSSHWPVTPQRHAEQVKEYFAPPPTKESAFRELQAAKLAASQAQETLKAVKAHTLSPAEVRVAEEQAARAQSYVQQSLDLFNRLAGS